MDPLSQAANSIEPQPAHQQNVIQMVFQWQTDSGPRLYAYWEE